MNPLEAAFSLDSTENPRGVLEGVVTRILYEQGLWGRGVSDGLVSYRTTECGPTRVRLHGKLIEIAQTRHAFWLDVERDAMAPARLHWTLYFEVDPSGLGRRRLRNILDAIDEPNQIAWLATLIGTEEPR